MKRLAKTTPYGRVLSVRLNAKEVASIEAIAARKSGNVGPSAVLRLAVQAYLAAEEARMRGGAK